MKYLPLDVKQTIQLVKIKNKLTFGLHFFCERTEVKIRGAQDYSVYI